MVQSMLDIDASCSAAGRRLRPPACRRCGPMSLAQGPQRSGAAMLFLSAICAWHCGLPSRKTFVSSTCRQCNHTSAAPSSAVFCSLRSHALLPRLEPSHGTRGHGTRRAAIDSAETTAAVGADGSTEDAEAPVLAKARGEVAEKAMADSGFLPVLHSFNVFAAPSRVHGWGVYAAKEFVEGEMLHESPGRLLQGDASEVRDDIFEVSWDDPDADNLSILGLGFASLHNHADEPNAAVWWEKSERHGGCIVGTFYALRSIQPGEELLISYGDAWWADRDLNKTGAVNDGGGGGNTSP